ncbi:MAG: hypothetical protein KatS3mg102_0035 [Planctomycetota bacterium]|nr:MAG: hypothetical protein KatS3mg102_0035 [Planctomycetota bacterium]
MHPLTRLLDRQALPEGKLYGLVPAIVTDVKDTEQNRHEMAMVRVYFPWLQDQESPNLINPWARLVRVDAGDNAGMGVVPQVGDEVICGFEHGDIHHPYVLGSVWNGQAKAPDTSGNGEHDPRARGTGRGARGGEQDLAPAQPHRSQDLLRR